MIVLDPGQLRQLADAAEAAFPKECCGLLVGRGRRPVRVTRLVPSANLAPSGGDRFEIDPQVRFDTERRLRGTAERVVGHYHSHPNGTARPSPTDVACAWEPDLVWVIVGVVAGEGGRGQAIQTLAWRLDRARGTIRAQPLATGQESACIGPALPT